MKDQPDNHTYYRIKGWADNFENNRTREMKNMAWVPVPNKHDGEGFKRIMQEQDGIQIYGCWHLILQVASKCDDRGTLLRDDGTPITAESISLKTGWRHTEHFERAMDFLCLPEVGWIERVTKGGDIIPQEGAGIPQEGARNRREQNGMEGNGKRKEDCPGQAGTLCDVSRTLGAANAEKKPSNPYPADFERFWLVYPRKKGKGAAVKAFRTAKKKTSVDTMIASVDRHAQSQDWQKDDGQYIPNPATWLNQERWNDEVVTVEEQAKKRRQADDF